MVSMGIFTRKAAQPLALSASGDSGPLFSGVTVPPEFLYGHSMGQEFTPPPRVPREIALTVPAVKRSRDLIAGSIGQLPLNLVTPDKSPTEWALFTQPEAGLAPSITWTRVAEDLLFDGVAFLRVTHVGWHGRPAEVVRLDPQTVTVTPDHKVYHSRTGTGSALEYLPDDQLIRIDSPNSPLLVAGARAIRTCLALNEATNNAALGLPPMTYFTPADDVDPAEDDEIRELLARWNKARGQGNTSAYVPASLKLNTLGWNPEQLQLDALRNQAILEISRLTGVDAEELGVSTTSRTYSNAQDRRKAFLDFTIGPYMNAIEGRLTMPDVTPLGYQSKFNTSAFLRTDDLTRQQVYTAALANGALTHDEVRELEDRPPLSPSEKAEIKPVAAAPALPAEPAAEEAL